MPLRRAPRRSAALTEGPHRAPARAMLKAAGFSDEDLARPLIGVANTWIEIGPCNYHLRDLAADVKAGIRAAGGTPLEFNTVSISDGITMGTAGMKASLVSREVIADSIELVARGNLFDGLVVLVGCDKTIPGAVMALARLDIPGIVLYGGSIAPGRPGKAATSPSRTSSRPSARTPPAASTTAASRRSRIAPAPAPARAAASSPPTRWPRSASSSASRRWAAASVPAVDPARRDVCAAHRPARDGPGRARPAAAAGSSPARRSRTPSPASWPPAARPTPCCTCWPSPARPACRSRSTTSTRSATASRCSPT